MREREGQRRSDGTRAVASRRLNSRSASSIDFGGGGRTRARRREPRGT